ncbi:hypothetical protein [Aureimonas psammosilenae]|uniref:hypothetical protein n=1 Tax=Aureimonas psammosilenae TaxID=2495496 RepID=UPI0012605EE3|nr:hypothetical protein [Aureimonas psammosilenae]
MAKDGDGAARAKRTLSERLMKALTGEVRVLERMLLRRSSPEEAPDPAEAAGAKARVDAIGNLTKTLEKVLELTRLEGLSAKGRAEDEGEAERLRAELMKRLRALDARRSGGRRLFPDFSNAAGAV